MEAILALVAVLVIFAVSLVVIRLGSLALVMTGLSPEVASFQALSAFSGAGYTTDEAEETVSSPARRNIVKTLIRLGSVGIVTAIFSLVASVTGRGAGTGAVAVTLLAGVLGIALLARSADRERAVCCPLYYGEDDAGRLRAVAECEGRLYTHVRRLSEEYVTVTHDDPSLFFPDGADDA